MRIRNVLFALVVAASAAHAQEGDVVVHGVVKDASTGKPVPGASVYREETDEVAITDDQGEFTFPPAPPGHWHLAVVDPSYQRADAKTDGSGDVSIALEPVSLRGEEIVVEAEKEHTAGGEVSMQREEIMKVPGSNGDPLKAIKSLPGLGNNAGFGPQQGLVIRGSSPADSRIFVDGFEVPLLYHLGGITSVIPGEMIGDLVYAPGGFGVEWGKASAGIVQVSSREGDKQLKGFTDVSFINAQAMLQGPIGKDGSYAVSIRRSYIDAVIPLVVSDSSSLSFTALPRYYDYQARADYKLGDHLKLSAFVLGSDDDFAIATDATNASDPMASGQFSNTTSFQRAIAAATYDREGVYNKLAVSALDQRLGFEIGTARYLHIHNESLTARDDGRVQLAKGVALVGGGQAEEVGFDVDVKLPRPPHEGDPSQPNFTYDPIIDTHNSGTAANLSAWSVLEVAPVAAWKTTVGVRVDDFTHNHATVVQPRAQSRVKLDGDTTLIGAFGLYTRPPDNQDENLQADLKPERAWQSSLGVESKLAPGVTLQATAYYNADSDMIVQRASRTDTMSTDGSDTYENAGIGRAYGAEMLLQARGERFFGWVSYTYARSERQDHPMDAWRKFDEDQTHNLIVLGSYKLGARKQWQVGGRFQYTTGQPYTPVTGAVFDSDRNTYSPIYGTVNSLREPPPNQLDLRIDHYWQFQGWKLSAYLDVSNVYFNAPVVAVQYNENYTKRTDVTGIPILPALGVRGEF